jgi:RNA polymerase sigma factor (sigma-70 family)
MPLRSLRAVLKRVRGLARPARAGGVSDAALLERFVRQGDEAAFELLVWRHGPMVLGACRRVLRHEQDAEDAFQATFLTLARKAAAIGRGESLGGWLYTVAHRAAHRALRRREARGCTEPLGDDAPAVDTHPGPTDLVSAQELRPLLDAEVARLPEKYRAAFVLCYLEGKTNTEAAEVLGCPRGTVQSRLARARKRLRRRLSDRHITPAALTFGALLADHVRPLADVSPVLVAGAVYLAGLVAAGRPLAGAASPAALALADPLGLSLSGLKKMAGALTVLAAAGAGVAALVYGRDHADPAPPACCHPPPAASPAPCPGACSGPAPAGVP